MWKRCSVDVARNKWRPLVVAGLLLALAACSNAESSAVPTQTLVPIAASITPSALPPTETAAPGLLSPADVGALTATPQGTPAVDPVAAELVGLAQRRVSQETGIPTRRVELVSVLPFVWTDTSLGCPSSGETYAAVEVDGYRIEVQAGERSYIFHSDFDRIIACDAKSERLPATPTPTAG